MSQPPKYNRRIVSKSEYIQAQSKRFGFNSVGCILLFLAVPCAYAAMISAIEFCRIRSWPGVGWFMFFSVLTLFFSKWGLESVGHAQIINVGVPLTRTVADTLPAEVSLVRASEEPTQGQQAILLRAVTDIQETPPEQLVRSASGE